MDLLLLTARDWFVRIGKWLTVRLVGIKLLGADREGDCQLSEENYKYLVVVGRDTTDESFFKKLSPYLYDSFSILGIYALGEPTEMNDTERFICFISGKEVGNWTAEAQKIRFTKREWKEIGSPVSCWIFDSIEDALDHSKIEYNFSMSDDIQAFRDRTKEVVEKFGYSTAIETEDFQIMMALAANGSLALTRGLLGGEQVPVIVLLSHGADKTLVKPIAILMNESVKDSLELPTELREGLDD